MMMFRSRKAVKRLAVTIQLLLTFFAVSISSSLAAEGATPLPLQGHYSSCRIVGSLTEKAGLGDELILKVEKTEYLVQQAEKTNKKITLYLNGMALKGVNPIAVDCAKGEIRFKLKRTEESKEAWGKLLGKPKLFDWTRKVTVGIGFGQEIECPQNLDKTLDLIIIKKGWAAFWGVFLLIVCRLFMKYAPKSAALRNYGPTSPYSLALVQMAFWTILILFSYIFLWLVIGEINSIPESILVLLGIAAGTSLGARVIDDNKLNSQLQALQKQLEGVPTEPVDDATKQQREQLIQQVNGLKEKSSFVSVNFIDDILSDANGLSIHRIQIVVWTITFGFIFVAKVWNDLAMPEFNATQLALIGISSGVYLGFKLPEQH